MAFAVVGIQAHFSKTLLLFFIPQIFNFILSCPQLFGLVPCPRHRVPRLAWNHHLVVWFWTKSYYFIRTSRIDRNTHLLHPSTASENQFLKAPSRLSTLVLRTFAVLGLTELTIDPNTGVITNSTNLTILNLFLLRLGPMNEKRLVQVLMCTQVSVFKIKLFCWVCRNYYWILRCFPQGGWKYFGILRQVWYGKARLRWR